MSVPAAAASFSDDLLWEDNSSLASHGDGQLQANLDATITIPDSWPDDVVLSVVCLVTVTGPDGETVTIDPDAFTDTVTGPRSHDVHFQGNASDLLPGEYTVSFTMTASGTSPSNPGDPFAASPALSGGGTVTVG